jgi:hypothetical protein
MYRKWRPAATGGELVCAAMASWFVVILALDLLEYRDLL